MMINSKYDYPNINGIHVEKFNRMNNDLIDYSRNEISESLYECNPIRYEFWLEINKTSRLEMEYFKFFL